MNKPTFYNNGSYLFIYLVILVFLAVFFYLFRHINPAEDATIIFTYAENLWNTGRVSYYPDGPTIEGFTDGLFFLLLSLGQVFTLDTFLLAKLISIASIFLATIFIFKSEGNKPPYVLVVIFFMLFFSPQLEASWRGYGTWMWGMFLSVSVYFFLKNKREFFLLSYFLCIVVRLESGLILFPLLLYSFSDSVNKLYYFRSLFFLVIFPSGIYLIGKWMYFGAVLPNSFFITTQSVFDEQFLGIFYRNSFLTNYHFIKFYLFIPILICFFIALVSKPGFKRKQLVVLFSLFVIPFFLYSFFSQQMNLGFRYQMPLYLGLLYLFYFSFGKYRTFHSVLLSVILLSYVVYFGAKHIVKVSDSQFNNHLPIAEEIANLNSSIKLLTTESGIYPWKFKGETVDAWGLNTREFTFRLITEEDIHAFNPDMIVANCKRNYFSIGKEKTWDNMCAVLNDYFICNDAYYGYRVPNSSIHKGSLSIWIKRELEESIDIVSILEKHDAKLLECKN